MSERQFSQATFFVSLVVTAVGCGMWSPFALIALGVAGLAFALLAVDVKG